MPCGRSGPGLASLAAEVNAVDEGVDRGRRGAAGHGDRGVVAAAEADTRPVRGQPLPYPRQELELAHAAHSPRAGPLTSSFFAVWPRKDELTGVVTKVASYVERRQPLLHRIGEAGAKFGTKPPRSKRVRLGDPAWHRDPRLRLPRPHRGRPVGRDQGQGRALPRPLADPGLRHPADLLRAQRGRLGSDPALPRLPARGGAGAGRLGPAAAGPLRTGQRALRARAGCCSPSGPGCRAG